MLIVHRVGYYKKHRQDKLAEKVEEWIGKVRKSGEPMTLRPMNAADRRIVHRTVGDARGVESVSEGEGRDRHVIINPIKLDDEDHSRGRDYSNCFRAWRLCRGELTEHDDKLL